MLLKSTYTVFDVKLSDSESKLIDKNYQIKTTFFINSVVNRLEPIMLWKLPIMLLSKAQKSSLLIMLKIMLAKSNYARELTVLLY